MNILTLDGLRALYELKGDSQKLPSGWLKDASAEVLRLQERKTRLARELAEATHDLLEADVIMRFLTAPELPEPSGVTEGDKIFPTDQILKVGLGG